MPKELSNGNGIPEPTPDDLIKIEQEISELPSEPIRSEVEAGDSFRQYMADLPNVAPKNLEESMVLGKTIKENGPDAEWARNELFFSCTKMVVSEAFKRKAAGAHTPLMDLIGEGNEGLWEATEKYDYTRECRFSTYAMWRIRQKIKKAVMQDSGNIKIPQSVGYSINRVLRARDELEKEKGSKPDLYELSEKVGLTPYQVENLLDFAELRSHTSLNVRISKEVDSDEVGDFIPDENSLDRDGMEEEIDQDLLKKAINEALTGLTPKQREMLVYRNWEGLTHEATGEKMGTSKQAINQLEDKVLRRLRYTNMGKDLKPFIEERPGKQKGR